MHVFVSSCAQICFIPSYIFTLQIHYDRIGKDGLFSHKEITVLFVPELSDCLPSLETWRQQWLAHKNAVVERERRRNLKDEVRIFFIKAAVY